MWKSRLTSIHSVEEPFDCSVTFRPRSTSVAGTVSNAEEFACCCRAANDEDGYRVGPEQEFELTAVDVGHLGSVLAPLLYIIYTWQLAKLDLAAMALRFPHIAFSLTVRDLGLTLDQQLTFPPHINRLCRDCYYQLRQLWVISRSLTSTATATLVHAFVTSRLDYCSTLYIGLPAVRLGCIERVIRTAARLIGGIPRTGHVSAYMLDVLHWLPLQQRITFRIVAMVWRCILGLAPAYLRDLCHPTPGTRGCSSLRSSEKGLLL